VFENVAHRTPKAEPAICELGGTMDPPGPASPIDPDLFLKRPSYRGVWLDEPQRPPRCEADRLRGTSPRAWIAEALGNETFAGKAVFTQGCRRLLRSQSPLASNGNIIRAQKSEEFAGADTRSSRNARPGSEIRAGGADQRSRQEHFARRDLPGAPLSSRDVGRGDRAGLRGGCQNIPLRHRTMFH
jgi:hypothetical protein